MTSNLGFFLVEDDVLVLAAWRQMVIRLGHHIAAVARNGTEALELSRKIPFDIAILDIILPGMDGLEVARHIAAERDVPLLLCTGLSDDKTLEKARQIPVHAFLVKPFSQAQFRAAVAIALAQYEQSKSSREKIVELSKRAETSSPLGQISEVALKAKGLTDREIEVLRAVAEGRSNAEIGELIGAATRTVDKHVEHIFDKLDVKTRTAAVAKAMQLSTAAAGV